MSLFEDRLRCEGFLGGLLGEPVTLPEVREVSPEEIRAELWDMVEDALQERNSPFLPLQRWLERRVLAAVSERVLGIYTQRIFAEHTSSILLSAETVSKIAASWGIQEDSLRLWVFSHEAFHAFQLDSRFPLRDEMRRRAANLLKGEGDIREILAAMTWIEGSADWVMDQPGLLGPEEISVLREQMIQRRSARSFSIWMRLLRAKRNQYERGREMAEAAWQELGPSSLLLPVRNPELLPRAGEGTLEWVRRLS